RLRSRRSAVADQEIAVRQRDRLRARRDRRRARRRRFAGAASAGYPRRGRRALRRCGRAGPRRRRASQNSRAADRGRRFRSRPGVRAAPRIRVLEKARVLNLIVRRGVCLGVRASVSGHATEIIADATVLATGGCGQVYRYTTNPVVATGDGYAIAHRAGVTLADMEFVQFHPTALDTPENPLSLVSEAVRGEGAVLVNS